MVIVGEKNLPGLVPFHASELYARNVLEVVKLNVTEGALAIDPEDEINQGSIAVNAPAPPPPGGARPSDDAWASYFSPPRGSSSMNGSWPSR